MATRARTRPGGSQEPRSPMWVKVPKDFGPSSAALPGISVGKLNWKQPGRKLVAYMPLQDARATGGSLPHNTTTSALFVLWEKFYIVVNYSHPTSRTYSFNVTTFWHFYVSPTIANLVSLDSILNCYETNFFSFLIWKKNFVFFFTWHSFKIVSSSSTRVASNNRISFFFMANILLCINIILSLSIHPLMGIWIDFKP